MANVPRYGHGWLTDLPDVRDFTVATAEIRDAIAKLRRRRTPRSPRPTAVDLREYCTPPTDQGVLQATSAHAVVGLIGCFERRATGRVVDGSPLFLYCTARRLDDLAGDTGIGLRTTLKSLARFGCPPERHWPSDAAHFNAEPDAFAYGFQREFADLRYLRLDARGAGGSEVLRRVKAFLAAGWACVCGASLHTGLQVGGDKFEGDLAFPTRHDQAAGGTAFTVVGYDDAYRIRSTKGALLVRGTWGTRFGDAGFGHLPYRYVEEQLARDFWTVWKPEWAAAGEFEQPGESRGQ